MVAIILSATIFVIYEYFFKDKQKGKSIDDLSDVELTAKMINETKPTDIFILGENIDLEGVNVKNVDYISEDTFYTTKEYVVIIVNDLNNVVELRDEEIKIIDNYIRKDKVFFMYIGTKYASAWHSDGEGVLGSEGNLCFGYWSTNSKIHRVTGWWTQEDQEYVTQNKYEGMFEEAIMLAIEDYFEEVDC